MSPWVGASLAMATSDLLLWVAYERTGLLVWAVVFAALAGGGTVLLKAVEQ